VLGETIAGLEGTYGVEAVAQTGACPWLART